MLHSAIPNRASTSDETDAMRKVGRDQNFGDGRAEDAANKVGQLQEKERPSESRQAERRGANGDMLFDSTWRRSRTCEKTEGGRKRLGETSAAKRWPLGRHGGEKKFPARSDGPGWDAQ